MLGQAFPHRWTSNYEIEVSRRMAVAASTSKKHHHVPQVYLKRWADKGKVRVTKTATGESYTQPPKYVARKNNLYTIAADDLDSDYPSLWLEKHMSRVESDAPGWLNALDRHPDGPVRSRQLIIDVGVFVALQDQRTLAKHHQGLRIDAALDRFGREEMASQALPLASRLYGRDYSPERHDELLTEVLNAPAASAAPKVRALEATVGLWRTLAVPYFVLLRKWYLCSTTTPLLTCDSPVVYLGGPARTRAEPASWLKSSHFIYPISPHRLLVLPERTVPFRAPFHLTDEETGQINFEIVSASTDFTYETPGTMIASSIDVPPRPTHDPSAAETFTEAVIAPSRWRHEHGPPWAVARWYDGAEPEHV